MGQDREIYEKAINELAHRRAKAERDCEIRQENLSLEEPEYPKLVSELARTASDLVKTIVGRKADASGQIEQIKKHNLETQQKISQILAKRGLPDDYLEVHYCCDKCCDTGFVDGYMCSCLSRLMKDYAYERLNRDTPLSLSSFDNFSVEYYPMQSAGGMSPRRIMEQVLKNCRWYSDNFSADSPSLLFQGATGLGKTHISLAIAREAINKGYGVIYGSVQDLMNRIELEHFGKDQSGQNTLKLLVECDLLILDDLGTEFVTQFTVSSLYYIINSRLLSGRPTIISTNLTLNELEDKYTERIVSRIAGNYRMLKFVGNDIRMIKK